MVSDEACVGLAAADASAAITAGDTGAAAVIVARSPRLAGASAHWGSQLRAKATHLAANSGWRLTLV